MVIVIAADGTARLDAPHDFRAFKVTAHCDAARLAQAAATIGHYAPGEGGGHIFVPMPWLIANGPQNDDIWVGGLMQMVAFAASKGWTDETGAVRAHVEFAEG